MDKRKMKKLLILNLPYFLVGLFATNLGEAWRLAEGADSSAKILSFFHALPIALNNPFPSFHPLDLLIGILCGAGLRLAVYLKGKNAKKYLCWQWYDDPLRKPHFLRFYRIELLATAFLLLRQNQKLKEGWRLSAKLDRIGADLEKARKKRAEWDAKVKDLERRYREEENSEIHEMVHAANLNPEQLSELLRMFAADMAPKPDTINTMNEEETQNEI